MNLVHITLIPCQELEKDDKNLVIAKNNRSLVEYYFTSKPFLCLYILKHYPEVNVITYLDADLFFFEAPKAINNEMEGYSIALTGHRFPSHLREFNKKGLYNAGWISFRRDESGLSCLSWWRDRCFEWCYDYIDGERYADQKYLDKIPSQFQNVLVMQNKGANLAPWNISNYKICRNREGILVDDHPLVFFHFHGLKQISKFIYDSGFSPFQTKLTSNIQKYIYLPYIKVLYEESKRVPAHLCCKGGIIRNEKGRFKNLAKFVPSSLRMLRKIKNVINVIKVFYTHTYILVDKEG